MSTFGRSRQLAGATVIKAALRVLARFPNDGPYLSHSQEGEDMVARRLVWNGSPGFYVDVGAHHPNRFSNTAWFYRQGWRGINVEPDPDLIRQFASLRPRDTSLMCAAGEIEGELELNIFDEPALKTLDPHVAAMRQAEGANLIRRVPVSVRHLSRILGEHIPASQSIDFLTVDVEGFDLGVLKSNNWELFRPRLVMAECHGNTCLSVGTDPVGKFMAGQDYLAVAKTLSTAVFVEKACAEEMGIGLEP